MALDKYREKRDPAITPEPFGGKSKDSKALHFNIRNAVGRLRTEGDLFKGVLGDGIDMDKVLKKTKSLFK